MACSGGGADDSCGGIIEPAARKITTFPATLIMDIGADSVLQANVSGGCSNDDRTVVWISSNPQVATIDANGRVRAVRGGSTTLTASAFSNQARVTLPVTVRSRLASRIDALPAVDTVAPLGTRTLSAQVRDQAGSEIVNAPVVWRSLTPNLAIVSPDGTVSSVANGVAAIEATTLRAGTDSLRDTVRIVIVASCSVVRHVPLGSTFSGRIDASTCQGLLDRLTVNQYRVTVGELTSF